MVKAKVTACWIVRAEIMVYRVADSRHVRRLGQVIAAAAGPHEHVIREVSRYLPRLVFRGRQDPTKSRDMLVIPSIPVGQCRPFTDARDLVA